MALEQERQVAGVLAPVAGGDDLADCPAAGRCGGDKSTQVADIAKAIKLAPTIED